MTRYRHDRSVQLVTSEPHLKASASMSGNAAHRLALPWPLAVIDFEASSLEQDGYPIELGLALWPAIDEPILSWSTLIRPAWDWTANGHWSVASAKVHGIRGGELAADGREPALVAAALNQALGTGAVAWCDGGPYDAHWLIALFKAGRVRPVFTLGDWHRLAANPGPAARERAFEWIERAPAVHRARADAEQLLCALMHGVGIEPGPIGNLADHLPVLAQLADVGDGCQLGPVAGRETAHQTFPRSDGVGQSAITRNST